MIDSKRDSRGRFGKGNNNMLKHGMYRTHFHNVYNNILSRCHQPLNKSYLKYGGRGIKCEWSSFEEFRDDMYESFSAHVEKHGDWETTIDRIDNNGNYCKENCRWATRMEQASNKTNTRYITFNGETLSMADWWRKTGIDIKVISSRTLRGWSPEETLTTPVKSKIEAAL